MDITSTGFITQLLVFVSIIVAVKKFRDVAHWRYVPLALIKFLLIVIRDIIRYIFAFTVIAPIYIGFIVCRMFITMAIDDRLSRWLNMATNVGQTKAIIAQREKELTQKEKQINQLQQSNAQLKKKIDRKRQPAKTGKDYYKTLGQVAFILQGQDYDYGAFDNGYNGQQNNYNGNQNHRQQKSSKPNGLPGYQPTYR